MITLPASIKIDRVEAGEKFLMEKARAFVDKQGGARATDKRIHASDLLDPRMAYFSKKYPGPVPDRLIPIFLIGRILHSFVICAVEGTELDWAADGGEMHSKELDIVFSPDMFYGKPKKVREIKTSRSFYEPTTVKDLALYCEQVLIYLAGTNTTKGDLWVLFLNAKENGKTSPAFRVYEIRISRSDLRKLQDEIKRTTSLLKQALKTSSPTKLPLCRKFKCGKKNCEFWDKCKPEGRYGIPEKRWEA